MKLTERTEWKALEEQAATGGGMHLRELFADDPRRGERLAAPGARSRQPIAQSDAPPSTRRVAPLMAPARSLAT